MRYSVVIPVYNASTTIVRTINSCLQQHLPPLEIILVDDSSSDGGMQVVRKEFATQVERGLIGIIEQNANRGPSAARNKGWEAASGDYVAFLDSDDTWHPAKMGICARLLEQRPDTDLLWHDHQLNELPAYPELLKDKLVSRRTRLFSILPRNPISSSAIIFKRGFTLRFNESMRYCEDYDIALRTVHSATVVHLPLALTRIGRPILTPGGLSSNLIKMRLGELRSYFGLTKLNPFFWGLIPFLTIWSLLKHLRSVIYVNKRPSGASTG